MITQKEMLMETLFSKNLRERAPLADRMRPNKLSDFIGQEHIVGEGKLLSRAIKTGNLGSCIFWGPPGTGKTTLAHIIANNLNVKIKKLNAVSSGVSDAKGIIDQAKKEKEMFGTKTYLLLDECHRWNKAQSDCVLEAIEKGIIYFIGSTTENPYTSMTRAIVSRCNVFQFKPLSVENIVTILKNALNDKVNGLGNMKVAAEKGALEFLALKSGGDSRKALCALEIACLSTEPNENGIINLTKSDMAESIQSKVLSIDNDMHYDMLSAFCKSLRGCNPTASVYWSRRLIDSGVDPLIILRRTIVHAAEDVGMADPMALVVATSALTAYQNLGSPEGEIPLTEAVVYVSTAPKSNSIVEAISMSKNDVQNTKNDSVPEHLKNTNFAKEPRQSYKYPYDFKDFALDQEYLPAEIKDHNYFNHKKKPYIPTQKGHPCFWDFNIKTKSLVDEQNNDKKIETKGAKYDNRN